LQNAVVAGDVSIVTGAWGRAKRSAWQGGKDSSPGSWSAKENTFK